MSNSEFSIIWATRLVYSFSKLPASFKEYWTFLLNLQFSEELTSERILFLESKSSISNDNTLEDFKKTRQNQEQLSIMLPLVEELMKKASGTHEVVVERNLERLVNELTSFFKDHQYDEQLLDEKRAELSSNLTTHRERIKVKVGVIIWPLVLDFCLRWVLVWTLKDEGLLWIIHLLGLPALVAALSYFINRKNIDHNNALLENYAGAKKYNKVKSPTSFQYSVLFFLGIINVLMLGTFFDDAASLMIIIFILLFTGYYLSYLNLFAWAKLDEKHFLDQMDKLPKINEDLDADKNDEIIVDLQTKLQSITSRLEAYVLESALFGALAFSGFLQIMAENLVSFEDLSQFASNWRSLLLNAVDFKWDEMPAVMIELSSTQGLFSMISVETLICSILFLSVIAARLRFSDIADKVERALKLARNFNEKEEALFEKGVIKEKSQERFLMLNKRIKSELNIAYLELENMIPVTSYMRFFRNAGIATFLVILISSGLFISGTLSFFFTILGASTLIYFNRSSIIDWGVNFKRNFRILFVRKGYYILIVGVLSVISGILSKTSLKLSYGDWFFEGGIILIGFYAFSAIAVMPLIDKVFEDHLGSKAQLNPRSWNFIKYVWGGSVFLFLLGLSHKIIGIVGAGVLLGSSTLFLAILFIFLGYYLSYKKWVGILIGIALSIHNFGALFKILHFPGANQMLSLGYITFTLIFIAYYRRRAFFHRLLIITTIFTAAIGFMINWGPYQYFELGYQHYTLNLGGMSDAYEMRNQMRSINEELYSGEGNFDDLISKAERNLDTFIAFDNEFGKHTEVGRMHVWMMIEYYNLAGLIQESRNSKEHLETGLRAAQMANETAKSIYFNHWYFFQNHPFMETSLAPSLETDFLVALNRPEEAKKVQQELAELVPGEDWKSVMEEKLKSISSLQ